MKNVRRLDADRDSFLGVLMRFMRHPLRAIAMAGAMFCLIADVAITPGLVAAVLGAVSGVIIGQGLAKSRTKLSLSLAMFGATALLGLLLGSLFVSFEGIVETLGTTGALRTAALFNYGLLSFALMGAMRVLAARKPGFLALELGFVVLGVAVAMASHRHGVIARPLWLSDFAWRRGWDPADILFGIGIGAALISISLILLERKGRLSIAVLPLLPLIALLGVSCLEVTESLEDLAEASPETNDEEGDDPLDDDEDGTSAGGDEEGDGGTGGDRGRRDAGRGGGGPRGDGGPSGGGGRRDGGRGGGGADGDGGTGGGGGDRDGGTGGGGGDRDGGTGGGGGGDGGASGGGGRTDGGFDWRWDAGVGEDEMPEPDRESGSGDSQGQSGGPPPEDLFDRSPPTGEASVAPVAVVLFDTDYSPPSGAYYFRQDAWSEFNGSRLVPAESHPEADQDVTDRFPTATRVVVAGPPGDIISIEELLVASQEAAQRQEFEASGAHAQQALERSPGSAEAMYRLAVALMRRGDHTAALAMADQANGRSPRELRIIALQADLRLLTGDLAGARTGYNECVALDPGFAAATQQLEGLSRYELMGTFTDAGPRRAPYIGPLATDSIAAAETAPTPVAPGASRVRQEVIATVALMTDAHAPFGVEWPVSYEDARNPNPRRFNRAYRFTSQSLSEDYANLFGRRGGDPRWSEDLRALYLEQNPDPRFAELAQEIVSTIRPDRRNDPFARAVAIKLWLDERLTYSTAERHADVPDPTADFLFGNKIGYCVHFAHAAVFLWRAAGIPARIGVGFHSAESNRQGGSALLLRSGDAHAWPELYLEGVGWIPLDISAHENLDPSRPGQDIDLQQLLAEMAREEPPEPEDEVRDEDREPTLFEKLIDGVVWTAPRAFIAILLGILLLLYCLKLWRRVSPSFAKGVAFARRSFRRDLDLLAEVGVARDYGETREQFATRAKAVSPSFQEATEMILAAKFGPDEERGRVDVEKWRAVQKRVRSEVAKNTKWWRRLLGLIHPATFFDSR